MSEWPHDQLTLPELSDGEFNSDFTVENPILAAFHFASSDQHFGSEQASCIKLSSQTGSWGNFCPSTLIDDSFLCSFLLIQLSLVYEFDIYLNIFLN